MASKFAVLGLTQAMAFELAPHGIRVNCVCPGFVATPMQTRELAWEATLRDTDPETVRQMWINDTPLGHLEAPEDVGRVVAFLVSDDARFITGEAISVNGGAFMDRHLVSATRCRASAATGVVRPSRHHPAPGVLVRAVSIRPHQYGWV